MTRLQHDRIGCSGWNYKTWRGRFYQQDLPVKKWLEYYSSRFDTVEVNNTFYRLPESKVFAGWREQTPAGFCFAVKASRFLTHMKRLRQPAEPIARLFSRLEPLGDRLGPVLYQLPATMTRDLPRLEQFFEALPDHFHGRALHHVMEFRDPSWYVSDTFALLDEHRVSLCLHDKAGSEISEPFVGPISYVRFHGTSGHYHGSYSSRQLERWARRLGGRAATGFPAFAYFNNDPEAVATRNAMTLKRLMGERAEKHSALLLGRP
jgi:uncharacterized protein YecE (DUF72 family)